ncbi:hypothetical protein KY289_021320 [Solanum tuberosum]|nr:hypothetical protein KY289_021320 [Solanum tuberosum]
MEQSVQSPVIEKEPFPTPDSAGPSSDPKEKKDYSEIESVKQYLTEYVDNKFDDLKVFIKDNLKVLMKSVRKIKRKKKTARSLPISNEEAEEETQEVLEDDDTLKDKRGNDDLSEPPSTVDVPLAGNVSKKVFFDDTSKDPQAGEEVSDEVRYNKKYRAAYQDDIVDLNTKKMSNHLQFKMLLITSHFQTKFQILPHRHPFLLEPKKL